MSCRDLNIPTFGRSCALGHFFLFRPRRHLSEKLSRKNPNTRSVCKGVNIINGVSKDPPTKLLVRWIRTFIRLALDFWFTDFKFCSFFYKTHSSCAFNKDVLKIILVSFDWFELIWRRVCVEVTSCDLLFYLRSWRCLIGV